MFLDRKCCIEVHQAELTTNHSGKANSCSVLQLVGSNLWDTADTHRNPLHELHTFLLRKLHMQP